MLSNEQWYDIIHATNAIEVLDLDFDGLDDVESNQYLDEQLRPKLVVSN